MWQPLLMFLRGKDAFPESAMSFKYDNTEYPHAWELERTAETRQDSADLESGDEEDLQVEDESGAEKRSVAYENFLRFLELGCSGSPSQGYPTVVIILSTIPSTVNILSFAF